MAWDINGNAIGPVTAWLSGGAWIQGDYSAIPLLQPEDDWTINEQGISVRQSILAGYTNGQWLDVVPTLYTPFKFNLNVLYREGRVKQIGEAGDFCLLTLLFDQRFTNLATTPTPQPQYGVNAGGVEVDIRRHPNFTYPAGTSGAWDANAPWSQFWDPSKKDWKADASGLGYDASVPKYLYGVTKYLVGTATIWTKVFYPTQPTDPLPEGRIVDPGFGFGPSGCYKVDTCDQGKENAFWYRLTHFKYSATPWPTQIYLTGSS